MPLDIPRVLDRLRYRYPSLLVDAVVEHEPGRRIVAVKNVTVNEEYFQGHFPGMPLMPGVMMIESLVQVATLLLLPDGEDCGRSRAALRGVNDAKFRRQVLPGDRLTLEVTLVRRRTGLAVVRGEATVGTRTVAEAELLIALEQDAAEIDPTAIVHAGAVIGAARSSGHTRSSVRRFGSAPGAISGRPRSSTVTPRSAMAAVSIRSRRSVLCHRTKSSEANTRGSWSETETYFGSTSPSTAAPAVGVG